MITEAGTSALSSASSVLQQPISFSATSGASLTTDPVASRKVFAVIRRVPPSRSVASIVFASRNRAQPRTSSNFPPCNCSCRYAANSPMSRRLRSRISGPRTSSPLARSPNSSARRSVENRDADSSSVLLGMQPRRMHSPPSSSAPSTTPVFNPSAAAVRAAA